MTRTLLTHRSEIYSSPELKAFAGNGGSRINDKMQQVLKKAWATYPGGNTVVKEEVDKLKGSKGSKDKGSSPAKKRKAEDQD